MKQTIYKEFTQHEDNHWWFIARRQIIQKILNKYLKNKNNPNKRILEVGAATGGNLSLLASYGHLSAIEMNKEACQLANNRHICEVKQCILPNQLPYDTPFDLICILDVLEHIEDDEATLECLKKALTPSGQLLITVPAYKWLWSKHDVMNEHKRRYTKTSLKKRLHKAGLKVHYITYFNTFLFPIIAIVRILNNIIGTKEGSDTTRHSSLINKLLTTIFATERCFFPALSFPFGVSILALTENQSDSD